jgi:hypothetical protein
MAIQTIDLSGRYQIAGVNADSITLVTPGLLNPAWNYNDLKGAGSTGYAQNISLIRNGTGQAVDLGGTYTIAAVTPSKVIFADAEEVNQDWGFLALFPQVRTRLLSSYAAKVTDNWIGPFVVEAADTAILIANFIAQQGLFKDNGKKQEAETVTIVLEATPVDQNDNPNGAPQIFTTSLSGTKKGRDQRAVTMVCELNTRGRQSVRARRSTATDYIYKGTVVDEVKWQDLYGASAVDASDFGNVTTVRSRTYATEGALNVRNRKLNMLATRLIPTRIAGTNFTAPMATTNAADIFTAICRDPQIGGRTLAELDLDSIYDAVAEAVEYFGSPDAGTFSHTFDDDNMSFEETAFAVAQAVFAVPFRQGSVIKMLFERATEDSVLLFNHRNKVPGSETRTVRFGPVDDNDGIEYSYTAPEDDAPVTMYIPADRSAKKPRAVQGFGVRSHEQAYWHAQRAYNKLVHQHTAAEFTALQEAAVVVRNERVLVADNTRPDTQDGEVLAQAGLELHLSQDVEFLPGKPYTLFLQLSDGSVEAIPVVAGSAADRVVIARAPRLPLVLEEESYARTTYQLVPDSEARSSAFLITEKDAQDNFTYAIQAVNYSPMYYANDQMLVWLNFVGQYLDGSAWLNDGMAVGASIVANDATRGAVHQGGGAGDRINLPAFTAPASYTKAAWVRRNSLAGGGSILSSASTTHERVAFSAAGVTASHNAGSASVVAPWPGAANEWHHVAVTYDAANTQMAVFIDGEPVAAANRAQRALAPVAAVGFNGGDGLAGRVDDLRLLHRALAPSEVRALFRATRL